MLIFDQFYCPCIKAEFVLVPLSLAKYKYNYDCLHPVTYNITYDVIFDTILFGLSMDAVILNLLITWSNVYKCCFLVLQHCVYLVTDMGMVIKKIIRIGFLITWNTSL